MTISYTEVLGFIAAGLVLISFSMRTIVPLRGVAIVSNVAFFGYGVAIESWPVLLLHAALFPINAVRLHEALQARRRKPELDRINCHWRRIFARAPVRRLNAGDVVFRRGDEDPHVYFLVQGHVDTPDLGRQYSAGAVFGLTSALLNNGRRVCTARAMDGAEIRVMHADDLRRALLEDSKLAARVGALLAERLYDRIGMLEGRSLAIAPAPAQALHEAAGRRRAS